MKRILRENGVVIAFLVLFLINVLTRSDGFLAPDNLRNLVSQNCTIGIVAIGMTLVIMTAGIDLSVGSMVALCGAVAVLALNKVGEGGGIAVAALASLSTGFAAGMTNGIFIAYGRVAPFIVTLAGLAGFRSIALVLGQGGEIRSQVSSFQEIGFGGIDLPVLRTASGIPVTLYWGMIAFVAVALIAAVVLRTTRFGRHLVAIGENERAARYSAINCEGVKVAAYSLLGLLVGLAAFFNAARMNSVGTGSAGAFYELDAIAAVVIGGTSLRGGKGRILGTVVGVVLLTLIANMMTAYRIDTNWQGLVRGVVILVAVLVQRGSRSNA